MKYILRAFLFLILLSISNLFAFHSESYTAASGEWIVTSTGIHFYAAESKTVRTVFLDSSGSPDSIVSVMENDGFLWGSAKSGIFQIDMATGTKEEIKFPNSFYPGPVSCDFDYLWYGREDTLWRYDRMSREWYAFANPEGNETPLYLYSTGDDVILFYSGKTVRFSILEEKWTSHTIPAHKLSSKARYIPSKEDLWILDSMDLYRFEWLSGSWEGVCGGKRIVDLLIEDTVAYYMSPDQIFVYEKKMSVSTPLEISGLTDLSAFAKKDTILFIHSRDMIVQYDLGSEAVEYRPFPGNMPTYEPGEMVVSGNFLLVQFKSGLFEYDVKNDIWESYQLAGAAKRRKRLFWNEEGAGYGSSTVRGYTGFRDLSYRLVMEYDTTVHQAFVYDSIAAGYQSRYDTVTDSSQVIPTLYFSNPRMVADLTLHNQFSGGRFLDLSFDNSRRDQIAKKELYYRGNKEDRLQFIRMGTQDLKAVDSKTLPAFQYEGISAGADSKSRVNGLDRKRARSVFHAGYKTSRTRYEILSYQPGGQYQLRSFQNLLADSADTLFSNEPRKEIIPGSVKIWIDGELIDSTQYSFGYRIGTFIFYRKDLMDPTSVMTVSYRERMVPAGGYDSLQIVPDPNHGLCGYGDVSVSPNGWITPRIGFMRVGEDPLVNTRANLEYRGEASGFMMQVQPDVTMNMTSKQAGMGLGLQSRIGKRTSVLFNGLMADTGFHLDDHLSKGCGRLERDVDYTIGYDIQKEIPVSFRQNLSRSEGGEEDYYQISAGLRYPELPFIDADYSGHDIRTDSSAALPDSNRPVLNRLKNKARIRIYENNSRLIAGLFHVQRFGYDLSVSEFVSSNRDSAKTFRGGSFYGRNTISPIRPLTFATACTYRRNPGIDPGRELLPEIRIQMINLPEGVDLYGLHEWGLDRYFFSDTSSLMLNRSVEGVFRPGVWFTPLRWMSPRAGLSHKVFYRYDTDYPSLASVFKGSEYDARSKEIHGRMLGIHIFPNSSILYRNRNEWNTTITDADTLHYSMLHDLKIWTGKSRLWQVQWNMNGVSGGKGRHDVYLRYDHRWNRGINTKQGVYAAYSEDTLKIGPHLDIGLTAEKSILKKLVNNHSLKIDWYKRDAEFSSTPDISYTLYWRSVIFPNIALESSNSVFFKNEGNGYFNTLSGNLSVQTIF